MIDLKRNYHLAAGANDSIRVRIVGVGGAGSNALDRLVLDGVDDVNIVAMNTDVQSLTSSVAAEKVQLGRATTRGLGAGGDPEVGMAAADEAIPEIRQALEGAALIFVCVGLGGGTGSGSAPLIANLAKEQGSLVVVFATMPFSFEGKRRNRQANEALAALQEASDVVICFENDKMGDAVPPTAGIHQAFASADQTISQSVRAICNLFRKTGLIHIGFDDLVTALRNNNSRCLFGHGEADGDNRANEALARALKSPLMEKGRMLAETQNLLVNVSGGANMTLNEVQILMEELGRHISDETRILFGASVDPKMGNRMSVTLISSIGLGELADEAPSVRQQYERPTAVQRVLPSPTATLHVNEAPVSENGHNGYEEASGEVETGEGSEPSAGMPDPADNAEAQAGEPAPVTPVPRPRPVIRSMPAAPPLSAAAAAAALAAGKAPQQETLQFEPVTRGRFEKSEPTIIDGEDLDVPTFLRRNVRLK